LNGILLVTLKKHAETVKSLLWHPINK
jgi:WD40 repeat protein